jgi:hypothetical protein
METKRPSFSRACRLYRLLLLLYPKNHRQEYGTLMVQLFRDQCREAHRDHGARGLWSVWARLMGDLVFSATKEHLSNLKNHMKTRSIHQLTQILFGAAVGAALLANPGAVGATLATILLYVSTLLIGARAVAECFRPTEQWGRALVWGAAVLVVYALIMPAWAKLHQIHGSAFPVVPALHMIPVFANIVVPGIKAILARTSKIA